MREKWAGYLMVLLWLLLIREYDNDDNASSIVRRDIKKAVGEKS